MRLSRPRVLLRAALLAVGSGYMAWRAQGAWRAAQRLAGGEAALQVRMAQVFALIALLALLTAGIALSSLRRRRRGPTLSLGTTGAARPPGEAPPNPGAPARLQGPGDPP